MSKAKIAELTAKIEKAKGNKMMPEALKKQYIAMYEKQIAELEGEKTKAEKKPAKKTAHKKAQPITKHEEKKVKESLKEIKKETKPNEFNELIKRLIATGKYDFLKNMSKSEIKDDMERTAKPMGWRFKGKSTRKPTKAEIKANPDLVYYEARPNKSDVNKVKKLATGGGVGEEILSDLKK
jgi:hypothetical protein